MYQKSHFIDSTFFTCKTAWLKKLEKLAGWNDKRLLSHTFVIWSVNRRHFQVSGQEPLTSSKSPIEKQWISHTFNHAESLKFGTWVDHHNQSLPSGTINIFHARNVKQSTQADNLISRRSVTSKITSSSKSPLRNHQHPPSPQGSWGFFTN